MLTSPSRVATRLFVLVSILVGIDSAFAQAPTITGFSPTSGPPNRMITVTGTNFSGATISNRTVTINGTFASSNATTTSQMSVLIPAGATSGPITVSTSQGSATSAGILTVVAGPPPANDNFANALVLPGTVSGSITGNTANATKESGEPAHGGNSGGASVWYQWTAPTTGAYLFNPHITSVTNFGVLQAIYTGSSVNALTLVANGAAVSAFPRFSSAVAFNATAGVTYSIAIDGFAGVMGDFRLDWSPLGAPFVGSFSPNTGYGGQIGVISISGGNFTPGCSVTIAGATIVPQFITVNSASSISISRLPQNFPAAVGPVVVTTPAGSGTSATTFNLTAPPAPLISTFASSGAIGSMVSITGTAVYLSGPPTTRIFFNGTQSLSISITSSNSISARVPVGATNGPITIDTGITPIAVSSGNFTVLSPTISSFSPSSAVVGSQVTITGQNLTGVTAISFNGVNATFTPPSTTSVATSITATVPAGAMSGPLTVASSAGSATSASPFTVLNAPTIASFSPASGPSGTQVMITGTNFDQVTTVQFNGTAAAYTITSPTTIVATVPDGLLGDALIAISAPIGATVSGTSFTVTPPLPVITSFSPTTFAPTMFVGITGANLNNAQSVSFGGVAAQFTIDSATHISARVPFNLPPTGYITITTPTGSAVSATPYTLTPPAIPTITSFSPTSIAAGASVSIFGSGFSDVTAVLFDGQTSTFTVQSPTFLVATAPSNLTAGVITVITSLGSATSASYTVSPVPTISSMVPSFGPVNRIISVNGTNFSGTGISNLRVKVNGVPIGSFSVSSTRVTFAVPTGATTGPITVETSQGIATSAGNFVVMSGPPPPNDNFANAQVITGASGLLDGNTANATKEPGEPNHAGNIGGASVWFTWTAPSSGPYLFNPYNSTSSQFGIIQSIYTGNSVGSLTLVASGQTPTNVFARYGSAAILDAVAGTTYRIALDGYNGVMADYRLTWGPLTPPTIASFSPSSALAGQTINVVLTGSNFTPGAMVSFGGATVATANISYDSPTRLTVRQVPVNAVTGPITVTTPAGVGASTSSFVVIPPPPTIASFSPGGAKVGTVVTITGSNLAQTTAVAFNGVAASFSIVSSTTINAIVPASASTGLISVTTTGGSATSAGEFKVIVLPTFTQQPQSQTATVGDTVSFQVAVSSNGPEEYYWLKNGAPIVNNPSAATARLTLPNVLTADAGAYQCVVTNNAGSVTSDPATLIVNKAIAEVSLTALTAVYDGSAKSVTATTIPSNLSVDITYNGSATPPINAGSYAVVATVNDANYLSTRSATLTINRAPATIALSNLAQIYDGSPKPATLTTSPANTAIAVTYNGSPTPPTLPGGYYVTATIIDPNYFGNAENVLVIRTTALVRRMPMLIGGLDASVQVIAGEDIALNGSAWVSGDLLVPGTPAVQVNGNPTYGGTLDAAGTDSPAGYTITLDSAVVIRHVVRRVDPRIALPAFAPPPPPLGTRDVTAATAKQVPGDFTRVRDFKVTGSAGLVTVPAGTYGEFIASGGAGFELGIPNASEPAIYNLQSLRIDAGSQIVIVGPVVLTVATDVSIRGSVGDAAHPVWLELHAGGRVSLGGGAFVAAHVLAPHGVVQIDAATLRGELAAEELRIQGTGLFEQPRD